MLMTWSRVTTVTVTATLDGREWLGGADYRGSLVINAVDGDVVGDVG